MNFIIIRYSNIRVIVTIRDINNICRMMNLRMTSDGDSHTVSIESNKLTGVKMMALVKGTLVINVIEIQHI